MSACEFPERVNFMDMVALPDFFQCEDFILDFLSAKVDCSK
jgi:hypothetical protein